MLPLLLLRPDTAGFALLLCPLNGVGKTFSLMCRRDIAATTNKQTSVDDKLVARCDELPCDEKKLMSNVVVLVLVILLHGAKQPRVHLVGCLEQSDIEVWNGITLCC